MCGSFSVLQLIDFSHTQLSSLTMCCERPYFLLCASSKNYNMCKGGAPGDEARMWAQLSRT